MIILSAALQLQFDPYVMSPQKSSQTGFCIRKSTIPNEPAVFCFNLTKRPIPSSFKVSRSRGRPVVNFGGPIAPLVPASFLKSGFDTFFSNDTQQFIINCGSPKLGDYYRSLKSGQMCN